MKPEYVRLKILDRIIHFSHALFFGLAFLIITTFITIKGVFDIEILIMLALMLLAPAAVFYAMQKHKLQLRFIKTSINKNGFNELVKEISKEYQWAIHSQTDTEFTLKTNPGFINQSWGQHITLKLTTGGILLNSIFDTNKGTWLITFGSNAKNINDIEKIIKLRTKKHFANP